MSRVTLPSSRIPLTQRGDVVSTEFYRWMHDITERVGGVEGAGTQDLSVAQFEDAGIPEQQAEFYAALNAINSSPLVRDVVAENGRLSVEVEVLRAALYELQRRVWALEQGVTQ